MWLLVVVPVVALLLIGGGLIVWGTVLAGDDGPDHPDTWDPRVADIATFVEDERGLDFEHPIHVEFVPEAEFVEDVTSTEELSDEDREAMEDDAAELRAMGLVSGDVDLLEETKDLSGEGIAAYYDPEDEVIRIRGDVLTPSIRVTVAHELNHALQDQNFDIDAVEDDLDPDRRFAYRAIVEGDSVDVQNAYVADELSETEQEEYFAQEEENTEEADIEEISDVLVAWFSAPYAIGPPFVGIVEEVDGKGAINDLIRNGPPSEAALMNPPAHFDGAEPEMVDAPPIDDGAEVVDEGSFGALSWYLVLAARVDPKEALTAVDSWAGDSYKTYEQDDRVCLAARFRGSSTDATTDVAALLEEWVAAMPADVASVSELDDRTLELRSCDPGVDAETGELNDLIEAMGYPTGRLYLASQMMSDAGLDFDQAWCVATDVIQELSLEDLQAQDAESISPEVRASVIATVARCSRDG